MVSEELEAKLSPEERAAFESIRDRQRRLTYTYQNYIQELAKEGEENGYWIGIIKEVDGGKELRKQRFFRQKWITTKEHNEFMTYRGKTNKETDPEVVEDMTTRLYELGAKRFLAMTHDLYESALTDEVRMAVDACIHTMSWNGRIGADTKDRDAYEKHVRKENEPMETRNKFVLGKDKEEGEAASSSVVADEPNNSYTPLSTDYPDY